MLLYSLLRENPTNYCFCKYFSLNMYFYKFCWIILDFIDFLQYFTLLCKRCLLYFTYGRFLLYLHGYFIQILYYFYTLIFVSFHLVIEKNIIFFIIKINRNILVLFDIVNYFLMWFWCTRLLSSIIAIIIIYLLATVLLDYTLNS